MGLATTRASLLRGEGVDEFGDPIDLATPVNGYRDFPISLIQRSRSEQDPNSGMWHSVAYLEGRVGKNVPVMIGDRVKDNRTGIVYAITDSTATPRGISGLATLTLTLTQTSA